MAFVKSSLYKGTLNSITEGNVSAINGEIMASGQMEVQVVDGLFSYGKSTKHKNVLKGLNLNIMKGEIYALLGPSGCGKTTVLKCITKSLKFNSGEIRFSNKNSNKLRPRIPGGDVGYMPQELALFPDLTIEETLHLFAGINGVSTGNVKDKINTLAKTFGITQMHRQVGILSGGQKRRVSLIATLLHNPPLLVLDEPTVGIDPVLRQTIWNYLMYLTKEEGRTVILTTHYIQEAKDANTVALMRDGSLMAECSPAHLLQLFNVDSLEVCFLRICLQSEHSEVEDNLFSRNSLNQCSDPSDYSVRKLSRFDYIENWNLRTYGTSYFRLRTQYCSTKNVYALLKKNVKFLTRNCIMLLFQLVFPAIIMVVFSSAVGTKLTDIPVAIVNNEIPADFSERYLKFLEETPLVQNHFVSMEDGIQSVISGENKVVLYINEKFSECLNNRLWLGVNTDNYTADCALLKIHMDNTNYITSLNLQLMFWKTFESFVMERLSVLDASPYVDSVPVTFEKPVYGNSENTFNDYFTPSTLLYVVHYLAVLLTAVCLVLEKQSGVFERLKVCGVKTRDIILSQMLMNTAVVFFQVLLMIVVQFVIFGSKCEGSLLLVILIMTLEGFCGMVFGLLLSAVYSDLYTVLLVAMGVSYPNLFVCGMIWPLEGMPKTMRLISRFLPLTMSAEAMRSIMTKGWGLENLTIWFGLISVGTWSVVFTIGTLLAFKNKK